MLFLRKVGILGRSNLHSVPVHTFPSLKFRRKLFHKLKRRHKRLTNTNKKKTLKRASFLMKSYGLVFDPTIFKIDIDLKFVCLLPFFLTSPLLFSFKYLNNVTSLFSTGLFFFLNIGWDDWDSGMWENGFPNHVPPLSFWTVIFGLAWITVITFQPESLCKMIFLKHFSHSSRDQKQSHSSLSAKTLTSSFYGEVARAKFPLKLFEKGTFSVPRCPFWESCHLYAMSSSSYFNLFLFAIHLVSTQGNAGDSN